MSSHGAGGLSDSTVREVLDAGYIPVKVNGNADESVRFRGQELSSRAWAQQQGIYVFPGTLILDPEGNQLKRYTGFMNTDELSNFFIVSDILCQKRIQSSVVMFCN